MKLSLTVGAVVGAATLMGVCPLAPASAINNIKGFGVEETLKDFYSLGDFSSEIGYTVRNLKPSRDVVAFPVAGRLYESDTTATSKVGTVFPQIGNFRARTPGGADYGALPVSTVSGAPLGQGGTVTGKLYFDVVGENPDSVIFNAGFQDLLGWVGQQPVEPAAIVPDTDSSGGGGSSSTGGGSTTGAGPAATGSTGPNLAIPPDVPSNPTPGAGGPVQSDPGLVRND